MTPGMVTLTDDDAVRQSLARGRAGTALLHIERALTGSGNWESAHSHIRHAATGPVDAAAHTGLYFGAPALAFMLHTASDRYPRYRAACEVLDEHVLRLTRRRLASAANRIKHGGPLAFSEFDLFYGLTGIGVLLLRRDPKSDALARILQYVVSLTEPRRQDDVELPGWWVDHDPDEILPTPGGHANFGMAHGVAGLLALLALATARGCMVDGQQEAIAVLTDWFDRWQQESADGPWWPQWITREELHTGHPVHPGPGRPSWCYGTVGVARARQLAALATDDLRRAKAAEDALAASLTDTQLDRITEPGLCHGIAGVYQTAYRAAHDAQNPAIDRRLPVLGARLAQHAGSFRHQGDEGGLLTGGAGVALALETMRHTAPPRTGWDACLLIA